MEKLAEEKVGFHSLTEAINTTTPVGRMMLQMLAAVSEFEVRTLERFLLQCSSSVIQRKITANFLNGDGLAVDASEFRSNRGLGEGRHIGP